MSTRRWYAAGLGAVVLLALGACTGEGEDPGTSPSSSSSSTTSSTSTGTPTTGSPTTTATVTPADLPPEARKHTPEGAAAFVKYYLAQINEAWTTPKAGLLPPLSDEGCLSCQGFEKTAQELAAEGHRYKSTPSSFDSITPVPGAPAGKQYVRVLGTQHRVDIVDTQGQVVSTDSKKEISATVLTVWEGDRWLLFDMG